MMYAGISLCIRAEPLTRRVQKPTLSSSGTFSKFDWNINVLMYYTKLTSTIPPSQDPLELEWRLGKQSMTDNPLTGSAMYLIAGLLFISWCLAHTKYCCHEALVELIYWFTV